MIKVVYNFHCVIRNVKHSNVGNEVVEKMLQTNGEVNGICDVMDVYDAVTIQKARTRRGKFLRNIVTMFLN